MAWVVLTEVSPSNISLLQTGVAQLELVLAAFSLQLAWELLGDLLSGWDCRDRCCCYLVVTFGADPHAPGNGFQGWSEAVQMVNTCTCVTHEQLTTAPAHSAEVLMDVSLSGRIAPISFTARLGLTNQVCRGRAEGRGHVCWFQDYRIILGSLWRLKKTLKKWLKTAYVAWRRVTFILVSKWTTKC